MVAHARKDDEGEPGIYMLPSSNDHLNIDLHEEQIPPGVLQYCKTAQDIYFSGNLMATNVLIKTALETMFDGFLPKGNSRNDLSEMIRDSISTINHNEPLAKLSSSTKEHGDLHALFSKHHGTGQDTADAMMQLLETLIMYLYILPARFEALEAQFAALNVASDKQQDEPGDHQNKNDSQHFPNNQMWDDRAA